MRGGQPALRRGWVGGRATRGDVLLPVVPAGHGAAVPSVPGGAAGMLAGGRGFLAAVAQCGCPCDDESAVGVCLRGVFPSGDSPYRTRDPRR